MPIYRGTADVIVPDMPTPEAEAAYIAEKRNPFIAKSSKKYSSEEIPSEEYGLFI